MYRRAGVSGLTVAYLLSQDPANKVTVLAKHMPGDYDIEYASPWAGANYMPYDCPPQRRCRTDTYICPSRVGKEGSNHQAWEKATWPALKELTEKHPEAGIHFRGMSPLHLCVLGAICLIIIPGTIIYNRKKDQGSATGQWFSELTQPNPWYKDVVPDVCQQDTIIC